MATLGELRKKLAKLKKEGASTQTKGRVQYQINQLLKKTGENSGKVIRSGNGSIIKSSSGAAVRQKANKAKPKAAGSKSKTTGPSKRPNVVGSRSKTSTTGPSKRPSVGPRVKVSSLGGGNTKTRSSFIRAGSADKVIVPKISIGDATLAELRSIARGGSKNAGFTITQAKAELKKRGKPFSVGRGSFINR